MYLIAVYDESQYDEQGNEIKILLEKWSCQFIKELKVRRKIYKERYPEKKIVIKKRYRDGWKEVEI